MTKRLANPTPNGMWPKPHLREKCLDGARQSAIAKKNPRRHAFNGVSVALKTSTGYKERTP